MVSVRVGENAFGPMAELARLRDLAARLILFRCYASRSDGSGSARLAFKGFEVLRQNPQGGL